MPKFCVIISLDLVFNSFIGILILYSDKIKDIENSIQYMLVVGLVIVVLCSSKRMRRHFMPDTVSVYS